MNERNIASLISFVPCPALAVLHPINCPSLGAADHPSFPLGGAPACAFHLVDPRASLAPCMLLPAPPAPPASGLCPCTHTDQLSEQTAKLAGERGAHAAALRTTRAVVPRAAAPRLTGTFRPPARASSCAMADAIDLTSESLGDEAPGGPPLKKRRLAEFVDLTAAEPAAPLPGAPGSRLGPGGGGRWEAPQDAEHSE